MLLFAALNMRAEHVVARAYDLRVPMTAQQRYDLLVTAAMTWPFDKNIRWAPAQFASTYEAQRERR